MKAFRYLIAMFSVGLSLSYGQTTLIAPDTTTIQDTTVMYVHYTGSTAQPLFKWVVTDTISGYDTVKLDYFIRPNYKIGADTVYKFVFPHGGNYDVILETPETLIRKRVHVWEARRVGACGYPANEMCGNMVLNGRFEDFTAIPVRDEDPMDYKLCNWFCARGTNIANGGVEQIYTADFFTPGATGMMPADFDVSPPFCTMLNETSHAGGTNFVGFMSFASANRNPPYANFLSECFQQTLATPLMPGRTYTVTAWVSLGEASTHATKFSFVFTNSLPKFNNLVPVAPTTAEGMVIHFSPVTQRTGWVQVTTTFTYTGTTPAYYLTIGNWNTIANSGIVVPPTAPTLFPRPIESAYCYYAMDDIEIKETNNPCCTDYAVRINGLLSPRNISEFTITPGQKILIQGEVIINQNFTFNNNEVVFGPYAKVTVQAGKTLQIFNNSYLHACTVMWQGIYASSSTSQVLITDSRMDDAIQGIYVENGARVNATNATFNRNLHSIRYNNYNAFYPTSIQKTYFNCSIGLLPPYWNQKSYAHIIADNAGTVQLTPTGALNYNRYYNSNFGIIANTTALVVSNSRFVNIKNYNAGNSFAITSNNYQPLAPYLGVGDLGTGLINQFLNCDNGININGNITYQIYQNSFQNITYKAVYGINNRKIGLGTPPTVEVDHNTFTNVMRGVDLVDFNETNVLVDNNTLTNTTANPSTIGIRLANTVKPPTGHSCTNTYPSYERKVVNNRIDQFGIGVNSNFVRCLLVDNNNVFPRAQAPGQFTGIGISFSPFAHISSNHVIGDVSDWRLTAIRSDNSTYAKVRCNTTEKCGPAFMFGGALEGQVKVYNNDMTDAEHGIYLNYADIGPQIGTNSSHNNRWHGTFTNHFYTYNSFGHFSPFYFVNGTQGTDLWPIPLVSVRNSPAFSTIPNPPPFAPVFESGVWGNCSLSWYGGDRAMDSLNLLASVQDIVTEATLPPAYEDEVKYLRKLSAYSLVTENPWLLSATPEISSFMADTGEYTKIYKAYAFIAADNYGAALGMLSTVDVTDSVNKILVTSMLTHIALQQSSYGIVDIYSLPKVSDLIMLREYAEKCIFQYNQGTLSSRLILDQLFGWEFSDVCEEPKNAPQPPQSALPAIKLYPNPASNSVTVDFTVAQEQGSYGISLFDIAGKQVFTALLHGGTQQINLPNLPDGLYIYRINSESMVIHTGKLVIKQ